MGQVNRGIGHRKGLEIPTSMLVIIVIAVLVVVVLIYYFSGIVTISMSEAKANEIFRTGCLEYCSVDSWQNYINAQGVSSEFLAACKRLGYDIRATPCIDPDGCKSRCLEYCGKNICNMDLNDDEVASQHDRNMYCLTHNC
jgi:hypothetical protein